MLLKIFKDVLEAKTEPGMYSLFPSYGDRKAWESIDEGLRNHIVSEAEELIGYEWPRFKATDYTEYHQKGLRNNFDRKFKAVYDPLTKLAIAECVEGKGRFIDDIANGVLARCEDTAWIHTAHLDQYGDETMPRHDGEYMDLRCCSTGKQLALIYFLMSEKLAEFSPYLVERMQRELKSRILDRYLNTDQWWTNLEEGYTINNWNTHCNKCVITVALIMEKDRDRLVRIMEKAMKSLDVFLSIYADDGACDEGPGYWKGSALSFIGIIRMLSTVYSIEPDMFIDEKIRNLGNYICKVFIHGDRFMSYADGSGKNPMFDVKLYLEGKILDDCGMMDMALEIFRGNRKSKSYYDHFIYILADYIEYALSYNDLLSSKRKGKAHYMKNSVLPDSHIFAARTEKGSEKGFFIGIKGGHNDESHNHNDIGCPFIYLNGEPVVIDPAAGAYTSKTFSAERYDIWTMQSAWHSLPVVNGHMQQAGREYKSGNFKWEDDGKVAWASMDISKAYPEEAGIESYQRKILLDRTKNEVEIHEMMRLNKQDKNLTFHFTLNGKPELADDGRISIGSKSDKVSLKYDIASLEVEITEMDLSYDTKLSDSWGDRIYRVDFKVKETVRETSTRFVFGKTY